MYKSNHLNFRHRLADTPPHMPIDIVLTLPDYVTAPANTHFLFNLPGAINDLMGGSGWESASQVMKPYIWAPQWNNEELLAFAAAPFGRNKHPFPQINPEELRPPRKDFEIVHFIGGILIQEDGRPALNLGSESTPSVFPIELLQTNLLGLETRLLILQNPVFLNNASPETYLKCASQLAESIIAAGGPPVLVIAGADQPELVNTYLTDFYANIIHNQPLSIASQPKTEIDPSLWVELFLSDGGDELLRISRLRDELNGRIQMVRERVQRMGGKQVSAAFDQMKPYLHRSQQRTLEAKARSIRETDEEISERAARVLDAINKMRMDLNYSYETGAAIPLGQSSKDLPQVEEESRQLEALYPAFEAFKNDLNTQALKAPRVLNAGFADPLERRVLEPRDPLISGQEYDLIVDVGPRWSTVISIVTGKDAFPETALPPDKEGYPIHVVFISDDTDPNLFSDWIWVPRKTGRSSPYDLSNQRKAESGPIAFRIKAPALKPGTADRAQLHGRLCLYYLNNLLQSARVQATVARTPDALVEVNNVVDVDYVLSGTVQDLDRFATRKVGFSSDDKNSAQPIALNLTLNDDGKAHRIVVRELDESLAAAPSSDSPVGWTPFDPAAARNALDAAREDLKSCFYERDNHGDPVLDSAGEPKVWLDQNRKGKTRDQFKWDLLTLAKLGAGLFNKAFGDVRPEGKWSTNAKWMRALQKRLETSSIIQVSRTGPANYVFPWGLLYQYPLPGPAERFKFCRVIKNEWADDGTRQNQPESSCPFRNESWHVENVICPYGFWGLNHIIEQPVSALRQLTDGSYVQQEATDTIVMREADLDLSVVVTHDISTTDLDAHLARLGQIKPMRIHPTDPADDTDKVRDMLKRATLVYFLCHGEYDTARMQSYLSIGLRDGKEIHRIYPETLASWARTPDLVAWETQHPLIFINGCHTANLKPGEVLNFVTAFGLAGAGGIIGTEVSVLAPVAMDISERVFEKMVKEKLTVGQAMYRTRWELANQGNLLGLAYTLYCLANLHVTTN